jgi:hypothetical protein
MWPILTVLFGVGRAKHLVDGDVNPVSVDSKPLHDGV